MDKSTVARFLAHPVVMSIFKKSIVDKGSKVLHLKHHSNPGNVTQDLNHFLK